MPKQGWPAGRELVLRLWSDEVGVLLWKDDFDHLAAISRALRNSKTWGQLQVLLPEGELENLLEAHDLSFVDGDEESQRTDSGQTAALAQGRVVTPNTPFSASTLWRVAEGDYPGEQYYAEDVDLPDEFTLEFGEAVSSMISGSWIEYPMERAAEMKTELARHGIRLTVWDDFDY